MRNLAAQLHGGPAAAGLQMAETADDHQAADSSAAQSDMTSGIASDDACSKPAMAGHSPWAVSASAVAPDNASVGDIPRASGMDSAGRRTPADHMSGSSSVGMSTPSSGCDAVKIHAELECFLHIEGQ